LAGERSGLLRSAIVAEQLRPGSNNQPFLSDPRALGAADHRFWAAMPRSKARSTPPTVREDRLLHRRQPTAIRVATERLRLRYVLGHLNAADFTQPGLNGTRCTSRQHVHPGWQRVRLRRLPEANKARMQGHRGGFADGFFNLSVTGPTGSVPRRYRQPALDFGGRSNSDNDWRSGAASFVARSTRRTDQRQLLRFPSRRVLRAGVVELE
jgi:hypothetical protein